jgi:hypothetical protein
MQTFKVLVHGRGMVVRRWWLFRRHLGFYATRFVDAESVEQAGARALEALRGEPRLALAALRAPTLAVEEVEPVDAPASTWPQPGIVFYPAGADDVSGRRVT